MRKVLIAAAVLTTAVIPANLHAQDTQEETPSRVVITVSSFKVPFGEDRATVMDFIERVIAPQAKANPNVQAFYALNHYYGADARDVLLVSVYENLEAIEAPCGEPCEAWAASMPQEGSAEAEELAAMGEVYTKYYANHSDEIYWADMSLAKY